MAQHIKNVRDSGLVQLTKSALYASIQGGDLIFCEGSALISKGIQKFTDSPWSHVLMCWCPPWSTQWLTIEATIDRGVHIGLLADYIDNYPGTLVLAERKGLRQADIEAQLNYGFMLLDCHYDAKQEAAMVAHRLLHFFPVGATKNEFFCSGLIQVMSWQTPLKIGNVNPGGQMATPEEVYVDPSTSVLGAYIRGTE